MTENHVRLPICFVNARTKEWVRAASQTIVERLQTHFCGFSGKAVGGLRSSPLPACLKLGPARLRSHCWKHRSGWNSIPKTRKSRSRNPRRPSFLEELTLRDLQLGKSNF